MKEKESKPLSQIIFLSIAILSACIVIFPFVLFFIRFHRESISTDTAQWGYFSDFVNPFATIANLVAVLGLAYFVYRNDTKRAKEAEDFQLNMSRPVLVFSKEKGRGKPYLLKNIGTGGAINIVVKHKMNKQNPKWDGVMVYYSMKEADEVLIDESGNVDQLIAVYNDVNTTKTFVSDLNNNELHIFEVARDELEDNHYTARQFERDRHYVWE